MRRRSPNPTGPEPIPSSDLTDQLERWRHTGATVTWDDIVGHDAAKRELFVVTEQIRGHSVAERLGLTMVKGLVIFGPPRAPGRARTDVAD